MLNSASIKKLQSEKDIVISECDLSRLTLRHELYSVREAFHGNIDRLKSTLLSGRAMLPMVLGATSLLGLIFRRKKRVTRVPSLAAKVIGGWHLLQRVKPLWDAFQNRRRAQHQQPSE